VWIDGRSLALRLPFWTAVAGVLVEAEGGRKARLFLEPRSGLEDYFPSELTLRLPTGRYSVRTWDGAPLCQVGVEIATGPTLVCSPPCRGRPIVVEIDPLL
jgi:hypothetical protein